MKPVVTLAVTILCGRVWRDVSVCARAAIRGGGNCSKHRHRRATVLVEFNGRR
jgi:hypothetical protein